MTRVGLLHTVPALVDGFERDVTAALPGVETVHLVDAALLADAVAHGVDDDLRARVAAAVQALVAQRVDAVLATCSSIGEAVEEAAHATTVPVLRVDAPMADEAVRVARAAGATGRIAVLATLPATLGPTGRLIERAVGCDGDDAGPGTVTVTVTVVEGAAAARAAGDQDRSTALVAAAVRHAAGDADVVVLAQASMAAAVPQDLDVPVLTSPAGGVAALAAAVTTGGVGTLPGTLRA